MTDIKTLRELAGKATPGKREAATAGEGTRMGFTITEHFVRLEGANFAIAADIVNADMEPSGPDAEFIASCDPQTILALCDVVEEAPYALEVMAMLCHYVQPGTSDSAHLGDASIRLRAALSRIEALRKGGE